MARVVRWTGIVISVVAGTMLGAMGVAFGTSAGRAIVVATGLRVANGALDGTLFVGQVSGSLRRGLEARDVSLVGRDGVALVEVPTMSLRYRLRDLVSGRIVLGELNLGGPRVSLVKGTDGRFNFEKILRLGGPAGPGARPWIAFHNVEIDSGSIWIRTPASPGDTARGESGPELVGGSRVRRIENLSARFSYMRLSSPFRGEDAMVADVQDLRVRVSDPRVTIRGAVGRAELWNDSARVDFSRVMTGTSAAQVRGTVNWRDTLLLNLVVNTRDALVDDIRTLVPALPRGLAATGTFMVHSLTGDVLSLAAEKMRVAAGRDGGVVTGRAGLVLGPKGSWSVSRADVRFDNLDLEYVRKVFDTLPIAGRLSGRLQGDGPHDHLEVDADVTFRDSLAPAWPTSTVKAGGVLHVGGPGGITFQNFTLRNATIDLASVRRLLPSVALRGSLTAEGTVSGPWLEAEFDGTVHHVDRPAPETSARAVIQLDARRDTLGVWAKMSFDSLRLPGLRSSYPGLELEGAFAGSVLLEGYSDSLHVTADLSGPPGRLVGGGSLILLAPRYAFRGMDLHFQALDVHQLLLPAPETHLNGEARGELEMETRRALVAKGTIRLDSSVIHEVRVDSLTSTVSTADSILHIDTLTSWSGDARVTARGGLAMRRPRRDSLVVLADFRSLHALDPAMRRALALPNDTLRPPPSGAIRLQASVEGALDDYRVDVDATFPRFRWGAWSLVGGSVRGTWSSESQGRVSLAATADSVRNGSRVFHAVAVQADGQRDSASWLARARGGTGTTLMLAGSTAKDSAALRVPVDSARFTLPRGGWVLTRKTTLVIDDSVVKMDTVSLAATTGSSKIEVAGTLPMDGHGQLSILLETVSLVDLFAILQRETEGATGALTGSIDIAGTARAPQMHASLSAVDASYGDFRIPEIQGVLDYAAQRLKGEFRLRRGSAVVMGINADVPLDLALRDATDNRQLPGEIDIHASADSVDLAILEAISPAVRSAAGRMDGDVGINGTWERPQLKGALKITSGAATFPGLGVRHEDVNGRLVMHGDTLQIEELSGRSGAGTLKVGGTIRLENLTHPVFDLHLVAQDFDAMDVRNFLSFTATGEFDLRGPLIGATLSGFGTVPRGVLHYTDLLNKRIVNLEDTLFRGLVDTTQIRRQGLGRAFQNRFIDSLVVDSLRLELGSEVWLRSTEANIQLAGGIIASKVADAYGIDGTLSTPRGIYQLPLGIQFATRQFTVTRGQIRMLGTTDLNALVDIDAQYLIRRRTGDNMTVFVHIGGTLYVPIITLSSDVRPALPPEEIVSYLLFGGPLVANTAGAQSAQALSQGLVSALSGQIESSLVTNVPVLGKLDYFQITPPEAGVSGTQVQLGRQVDIFGIPAFITGGPRFGCQQSALKQENWALSLEFRLSKEWRVAGSIEPVRGCGAVGATPAANQRQAGADVLWELNY